MIDLKSLVDRRSVLLLGPRQTGKTTYLRQTFPDARYVDLLEANTFRELSARPELLRQRLRTRDRRVIIDEVQKLPQLLDEVQSLIDRNRELRVILTGSSARKLKRGQANLLGGRALVSSLHPLVSPELGTKRHLQRMLVGGLPGVIDSKDPFDDLGAYVGTYLREEIQAEGLVRKLDDFSRFLEVAATCNTKQLNYSEISSDVGVSSKTVQSYFQILQDTLVGHLLLPYRKTVKRKAVATPKFYFFDTGVANALVSREQLSDKTEAYGELLEHLIYIELRAYLDYRRVRKTLSYWRSHSKFEVDFIVGSDLAIEVKGKTRIGPAQLKGLRALKEENQIKRYIVVSREEQAFTTDDGIEVLPVDEFLQKLWSHAYV